MRRRNFFSRFNNWFVFILFTVVVTTLVFALTILINYLKKEEIKRIDLLANAIKYQQDVVAPDPLVQDLVLQIYTSNQTIPVIITDKNGRPIDHRNLPRNIENDTKKIQELAVKMSRTYPPIELKFPSGNNQFVYFDNSLLLNNLQYSPYILGVLIFLYLIFSFWFLRTVKKTDEGYVWAGLAKETAHQIGTPLSSMIGWIEILRMENQNSEGVKEIEKDINRLRTISERFSKIGSVPELNDLNLNETVQQNFNYLRTRISSKVEFTLRMPKGEILIPHNRILLSWVIENLVKNAVDAMKGLGKLEIQMYEKNKNVIIDFRDSGSGMNGSQARNVFKPGFSTKKRGWGLGLSLAKRVMKEYHKGDIKVAQTEVGKGTVFRITMKS
ncbi:sensor histidine kinase [Chryseobacterium sp.]|uniref:sensor histidine kinase n=1 Tax=Chryseobacterium sp. TaxID=1871047 RepID=UPI0011C86C10|nr:HAMP domain-containing sensor histidine kinase [Chryseobacterium sp.]TXF79027.1 HAMP domain-containing histidine kinase [Chryseobacterium sp.]